MIILKHRDKLLPNNYHTNTYVCMYVRILILYVCISHPHPQHPVNYYLIRQRIYLRKCNFNNWFLPESCLLNRLTPVLTWQANLSRKLITASMCCLSIIHALPSLLPCFFTSLLLVATCRSELLSVSIASSCTWGEEEEGRGGEGRWRKRADMTWMDVLV